jgi:hypothetical protein
VFICPNAVVSFCAAVSALHPSGMLYSPLFYAVRPNISNYANNGDMTFWHDILNMKYK